MLNAFKSFQKVQIGDLAMSTDLSQTGQTAQAAQVPKIGQILKYRCLQFFTVSKTADIRDSVAVFKINLLKLGKIAQKGYILN